MMQKFRLNLRALRLKITGVKRQKKVELWERDLSPIAKFKINARIAWRRFDVQTRGMGFIFVLLIVVMIVINIMPLIFSKTITQMENQPFSEALSTACKDKDFYNLNFRSCETRGVRP